MNEFIKSEDLQKEEVMVRHYLNGQLSQTIDAAAELARFKRIATAEPTLKNKKKSSMFTWAIGFASGIAACMALVLFFNLSSWLQPEKIIVYQSNPEITTEVTLQHGQHGIEILTAAEMNLSEEELSSAGAEDAAKNSTQSKSQEMQVITVPAGKTFYVTLYDGTKVHLNANSQLSFPETFAGAERRVMLQGEAYFEVTKDPAHPFVVNTSGMDTRVYGTEFNIKNYSQGSSSVVLVNGSVEVCIANGASSMLTPGQMAEVSQDGNISVKTVEDLDLYCAWHRGDFYFDGKTLAESCRELGQWFNRDVVFNGAKALDLRVHMRCSREETLESTLDVMNSFGKTHFYLDEDGTIVVE